MAVAGAHTGVDAIYGTDLFHEPAGDPNTLANLGPLTAMAGTFKGEGSDEHPVAGGTEIEPFVETYELEPIDRQTNGPQLLYGLRYRTHIVRPGETETFHDQVGYWLWEPATGTVTFSIAIPRGQVVLAAGHAAPDATEFEVVAELGSEVSGILSNRFLDGAFRTTRYRLAVTIHEHGAWSYESEATLVIADRPEPFAHIDRNTLTRIAPPLPNPLATTVADEGSLAIGDLRRESAILL
jgi:hypothetical protein